MASQAIGRSEAALTDNGALVETLWRAVDEGAGTLETVPAIVRKVLTTGAWRKRAYKGRVFEHGRFIDFITAKPLAGCGWAPSKVEALIKDDAETLTLWREAVTAEPHIHRNDTDNVSIRGDGHGNSKSYTLSRLKREAPELFERVANGQLSANAAAIEAGFRKKPTPYEQIIKLLPKLNRDERDALLRALGAA